MTAPIAPRTLRDDEDLVDYFTPLLGTASRRQLWLFFLDDEQWPVGPAIPIDDHPSDPHLPVTTGDLGTLPAGELFGARFAGIMRELDLTQVVVIWERRGGPTLDAATRDWARAFGDALRRGDARIRAQLLLHDAGLRLIPPDDLV